MSWLFSQALVEDYSGESSSGGEQSAPLNVMPTQHKFWRNDKTMEPCDLSRFGLTCAVLTDARGEELLTSYLAAFRARTSVRPARARASRGKGRDSGKSSPGSFAKYDRVSCGWKTAQYSLLGGLMSYSGTWPKWGSMRNGAVSQRQTPSGLMEHRAWITSGNESGSSVETMPTPLAHDVRSQGMGRKIVNGRIQSANGGGTVAINLATLVRLPSPQAMDGAKGAVSATDTTRRRVIEGTANLAEAVQEMLRLPTPHGFSPDGRSNGPSGNELGRAVNRMLTPTVQDSANNGPPSQMNRNSLPLTSVVGGSLNPPWVEWLMGWPIEWTDLKPLATDKFQQWLHSHGNY